MADDNLVAALLHGPSDPIMRQARGMQSGMMKADPIEMAMGLMGPRVPFPARISNPIKAYHGSPHDFDKFDLSKIGTGEGAQAYGHGLYFAEKEGVAKSYRDQLGSQAHGTRAEQLAADWLNWTHGDHMAAAEIARQESTHPSAFADNPAHRADLIKAAELLETGNFKPLGKMYEVALHATPEQFLDWQAPIVEQSPHVRQALEQSKFAERIQKYGLAPETLASGIDSTTPQGVAALREAGIPGIKYLDQGSRDSGQGTSNYVVWSPEIIEILRKYGLAGPAALGAASQAMPQSDAPQQ